MKSAKKVATGSSGKARMPSVKYTTLGHFRIEKVSESPPVHVINNPQGYADYWRDVIASSPYYHRDKEHLVVVVVNTRLVTKGWHLVSLGSLDGTVAGTREILRPVLLSAAYGFVLMHNHPTGDSGPSEQDKEVTHRICRASKIMGVHFIDHVIVSDTNGPYFSFLERGMMLKDEEMQSEKVFS